jgi:hypothetical protein
MTWYKMTWHDTNWRHQPCIGTAYFQIAYIWSENGTSGGILSKFQEETIHISAHFRLAYISKGSSVFWSECASFAHHRRMHGPTDDPCMLFLKSNPTIFTKRIREHFVIFIIIYSLSSCKHFLSSCKRSIHEYAFMHPWSTFNKKIQLVSLKNEKKKET